MAKIILIGEVEEYQSIHNLLQSEILNKNVIVDSIVLLNAEFESIDDIPVFNSFEDIELRNFDYFVLFSENFNPEKYFLNFKFEQKIIPGHVFKFPNFNFSRYEKLLKNPPSIVSRHY